MDKQMFCFQCEQTAGCSGCTGKAGVCGKTADTAGLQDELTGALIGLARACANNERKEKRYYIFKMAPITSHLCLRGISNILGN